MKPDDDLLSPRRRKTYKTPPRTPRKMDPSIVQTNNPGPNETQDLSEIIIPFGAQLGATSTRHSPPQLNSPRETTQRPQQSLMAGTIFENWEPHIRNCFSQDHEYRYMCTLLVNTSRTTCSFCSGRGHLPNRCASKHNVDEMMKQTGNAGAWGIVKSQFKMVSYRARRAARRHHSQEVAKERQQRR